jgi:ribose transport system ATP-binding protein
MSDGHSILSMRGISKRYGGVRALEDVDFESRKGSIHGVLGENGAGKSTLIKIAAGVVKPDQGEMTLDGQPVAFASPATANLAGVVCIFQELSLMPDLSVADNISASAPPRRFGLIDQKAQRRRAEALLARIGCEDVNPLIRVRDLPLSRRQMVEIAKALGKDPKVLILDEATSALTHADVETIYRVLADLKQQGLSILYISHRMNEIDALCDRLSVFRNGSHISSFDKGAHSPDEIVEMMIGREIASQFPPKPNHARPAAHLKVRDLRWENRLKGVSFELGKGEILGLGGLDGQGQKTLLLALFGVLSGATGEVSLGGQPGLAHSPVAAKAGNKRIALIPEDRKTEGLMLPMSVAENLVSASLPRVSRGLLIDQARERSAVKGAVERLRIKVGQTSDPVSTLSGGNQQKVVIAKWLMTEPEVILLNDPTRGIDVGTKQEIYQLLRDLAAEGAAILFYSTDYEELIGCCDRLAIMYDGRIAKELEGIAITEKNILAASLNIEQKAAAA